MTNTKISVNRIVFIFNIIKKLLSEQLARKGWAKHTCD